MQYSGGDQEDLNRFGLVLESVSNFDSMITKQVWLELSEYDQGEGTVVINREQLSTIDHSKIF